MLLTQYIALAGSGKWRFVPSRPSGAVSIQPLSRCGWAREWSQHGELTREDGTGSRRRSMLTAGQPVAAVFVQFQTAIHVFKPRSTSPRVICRNPWPLRGRGHIPSLCRSRSASIRGHYDNSATLCLFCAGQRFRRRMPMLQEAIHRRGRLVLGHECSTSDDTRAASDILCIHVTIRMAWISSRGIVHVLSLFSTVTDMNSKDRILARTDLDQGSLQPGAEPYTISTS